MRLSLHEDYALGNNANDALNSSAAQALVAASASYCSLPRSFPAPTLTSCPSASLLDLSRACSFYLYRFACALVPI
eukprot:6190780-Pleurochrysis_carterae.AAC.5